MRKGHIFLIILCILALDLLTKYLASTALTLHEPVPIMPFFNLTLVHNTGSAFGFLASKNPTWETAALTVFSLAAIAFFTYWLFKSKYWLTQLGITFIIAGALGNVIDRVRLGYVVDFLDFYVGTWHWPAFNVADSCVCLGVFFLALTWRRHD